MQEIAGAGVPGHHGRPADRDPGPGGGGPGGRPHCLPARPAAARGGLADPGGGHPDGPRERGSHGATRAGRRDLAAVVAGAPVLGEHPVAVPAQPAQPGRAAQPARTACVTVRVAKVTLPAQRGTRGRPGQPALPLWAIEAWEADPPAGTEPLRWLLLTTLAVPDFATAIERIEQCRLRWTMERLHHTLKSGL